jgi:hypothetical protein
VTVGDKNRAKNKTLTDPEIKQAEQTINEAIRSLNMSATTVYFLANCSGESYRDCLSNINSLHPEVFLDFYGITPTDTIFLLDQGVLNEPILDVIVQNSKPKMRDNLFD